MVRMTERTRQEWLTKGGKRHMEIGHAATHGAYACDSCGQPSASISNSGIGTPVVVACPTCYRAALDADRASRPTRAELIARVNAAIAK